MSTKSIDPTAFRPTQVTADRSTEIGVELEPITKKVTLDKMRLYRVGWPRIKGWHTDYEEAHKSGVDQPIAFASQVTEYIGELLIKFFGKGYLGGNLSLAYIRPIWPDDEIITKGIVREKTAEGDAVELLVEVWCENQNGEKVIAGTMSGFVS